MATRKIDKHGIPILDTNDIELKAEEVISYFDKSILDYPSLTPLPNFIEKIHTEFKLNFSYEHDLGSTKHGNKILGKTQLKPLGLFVDKILVNDPRFPFVLGHELGHVILHRSVDLKRSGYDDQEIVDTKQDLVTGKKILQTSRDRLEWQANRFSSSILMPRATLHTAIMKIQEQMGIKRNMGSIILEDIKYSIKDYSFVNNYLQKIYGVNATNIKYRLKELGILIDRRNIDIKHISELFMTE